jgi:hypothetical protein
MIVLRDALAPLCPDRLRARAQLAEIVQRHLPAPIAAPASIAAPAESTDPDVMTTRIERIARVAPIPPVRPIVATIPSRTRRVTPVAVHMQNAAPAAAQQLPTPPTLSLEALRAPRRWPLVLAFFASALIAGGLASLFLR